MHDGMPYGRNQGQGQGHSREVDLQSHTGLIFMFVSITGVAMINLSVYHILVWYETFSTPGRPIILVFGAEMALQDYDSIISSTVIGSIKYRSGTKNLHFSTNISSWQRCKIGSE